LAGHLGLDRFGLVGESGGAPFTLAAAHRLADRVSVVALVSPGGPIGPAERVGMTASARLMNWFARNVPVLNTFRVAAMRRELVNPKNRHRALQDAISAAPDATHATATRVQFEAVADALRQGTRATAQELALIKRDWPFGELSGHDVGVDCSCEITSVLASYVK
jgi:pimeloyl-ACP methyl ester carboxylesterase